MNSIEWEDKRTFFELPEWSDDATLKELVLRCIGAQKDAAESYYRSQFQPNSQASAEVSEERLLEILSAGEDVHGISERREISNVIPFNAPHIMDAVQSAAVEQMREQIEAIVLAKLQEVFGLSNIEVLESGHFWYPAGGWMSWHTNSKAPGWRLYVSYAEESGKSFFRYRDPDSGRIVTSADSGLDVRLFRITTEKPLWHAVYSDTNRFSIGWGIRII